MSLALSTPLEPNSGFLVAGDVGHSSSLLLLVLLGTFAVYCFPGAFALQRNFHDAFRRMFLRGGDYCVSEVRISTVDADTVS